MGWVLSPLLRGAVVRLNARYHPRPKAVGWMPLLAVLEPPLITVFTLRHLDYYLILFGIEVVVASMFALS